jgi:hypothetical protein
MRKDGTEKYQSIECHDTGRSVTDVSKKKGWSQNGGNRLPNDTASYPSRKEATATRCENLTRYAMYVL